MQIKKHFLGPELFLKFNFFLHEQLINLRFSEHCGKWHLKQMLAQFIVMSVVVRLLFTLLYHSSSSSPSLFVIFFAQIYFIKKEYLIWTSLLKILHKFFYCIRKGFFEVTILNQVIVTLQNYELLLYWKWLKEKQFANQTSFHIA